MQTGNVLGALSGLVDYAGERKVYDMMRHHYHCPHMAIGIYKTVREYHLCTPDSANTKYKLNFQYFSWLDRWSSWAWIFGTTTENK